MTDQPADQDPRRRIIEIHLDERTMIRRSADVEHERAVAIYDLIEDNYFAPAEHPDGPYRLYLSIAESRLNFDIRDEANEPLTTVALALLPFRRIVKDYFAVCESYYQAIKTASPSRIEAIDMGRRGLHDEGSELLCSRLGGKIDIDFQTARRIFTLICVLHIRG
ncbi:MAG TPA: UPF0262 family protein [Kiloniellales bacterium]|jgi:uncharacterized protein (UPF0262 family)